MIIDVEKAVSDYLTTRMNDVVGHGNQAIQIHKHRFPDDAEPEGIRVYAELRESHDAVNEIELTAVRITCRTLDKNDSLVLCQNVDDLFDKVVHKNLNSDVELLSGKRNAGPGFIQGENDDFWYGDTLYSMTVRYRGND